MTMKIKYLSLKKHVKPITCIKFNRQGDLMFTTSKDIDINVLLWNPENGDFIGAYLGHTGAVSDIDVNYNSTTIVTAGTDCTMRFWDVASGAELLCIKHATLVSCCRWSVSEKRILCVQKKMNDIGSCIFIYDLDNDFRLNGEPKNQTNEPSLVLKDDSITLSMWHAVWADLEKSIISSGEDGLLRKWNSTTGKIENTAKGSDGATNNIELAQNGHLLLACNKDGSVTVFLTSTLSRIKSIKTDRPLNTAALHPLGPVLILGGGQHMKEVTQTSSEEGKLEVLYHDFVYENRIGVTKNHFGPIYKIALSPDGMKMATGGHDSYIRLHDFEDEFVAMCQEHEIK